MKADSVGINRRHAARAHTADANSFHSWDAWHCDVMPGIGGVWQSCLESIRPASCPRASLQNRATLWCGHFG
jgi:hypothetical protein